jgi:hypothetical protein
VCAGLVVGAGVGQAKNATALPTAARRSTQRFGDLTFGISLVLTYSVTPWLYSHLKIWAFFATDSHFFYYLLLAYVFLNSPLVNYSLHRSAISDRAFSLFFD